MSKRMIVTNYCLAVVGLLVLAYIAVQLTRIASTMTGNQAISVHVEGGDIDSVRTVSDVDSVDTVSTVSNPVSVKSGQ